MTSTTVHSRGSALRNANMTRGRETALVKASKAAIVALLKGAAVTERDHDDAPDGYDALALYDRLVDQLGLQGATMALSVLEGRRCPTVKSIALAQARRELPGLLALHPRASTRQLAKILEGICGEPISHVQVLRWRKDTIPVHP